MFRRLALALAAVGLLAAPALAEDEPIPVKPEILPRRHLFEPLIADPRWPHFSAAWHDHGGHDDLSNVAAVSLGDGFSFLQAPVDTDTLGTGTIGIGLQAAVFAIFDLDAPSSDLVNADYLVALPLQWRHGPFSAMVRLYHQSSHLGDEFLLRTGTQRVNLSYEAVDLKLSWYAYDDLLRIYGGGGWLVHRDPGDLKPGLAQIGIELRAPWRFANERLRPIAAIDLQSAQAWDWEVDTSTRLGVELESDSDRHYVLQLTLDYFNGRNPNGQFYTTSTEFWGVGIHAYF
jgi:hypothetical protein